MTPDDLRQQVELLVVELIKRGLESGTMTDARAQELSQIVLDTITPGMSFESLYKAIASRDDTAPELSPIVLPVVKEYEEHVTQQALHGVKELIKQGQYDAASKLAQSVVDQKVKLVWTGQARSRSAGERKVKAGS